MLRRERHSPVHQNATERRKKEGLPLVVSIDEPPESTI